MKPYLQESYKKEFIQAMQAKGKLPKFPTEASDRHGGNAMGVRHGTAAAQEAAMMLRAHDVERRDERKMLKGGIAMGVPCSTAAAQDGAMMMRAHDLDRRDERKMLMAHLDGMTKQAHLQELLRLMQQALDALGQHVISIIRNGTRRPNIAASPPKETVCMRSGHEGIEAGRMWQHLHPHLHHAHLDGMTKQAHLQELLRLMQQALNALEKHVISIIMLPSSSDTLARTAKADAAGP
eukprot:gene14567-20610_t